MSRDFRVLNEPRYWQAYLEMQRSAKNSEQFDEEEWVKLDEDLAKAHRALEIEWLMSMGVIR